VVCISHNDALVFVEWMGRKMGRAVRLPTEAEWEYAARSGGKKYKYSWGNGSPSANIADVSLKREFPNSTLSIWEGYDDEYIYTAPVGSFKLIFDTCIDPLKTCFNKINRVGRRRRHGGQKVVPKIIMVMADYPGQ
jgi:hypothetical protein